MPVTSRRRRALLALSVPLCLGACTSAGDATGPTTVPPITSPTTSITTTDTATVAPPTTAGPAATTAPDDTPAATVTETSTAATRPPTDTTPSDTRPSPSTTEPPPVGDQIDDSIAVDDVGETPGVDDGALRPVFFAFAADVVSDCSSADEGVGRVRWEVAGTETVAIDLDGALVAAGLSPAGALDVPLACASDTTIRVWAENPDGVSERVTTLTID